MDIEYCGNSGAKGEDGDGRSHGGLLHKLINKD